MKRIYIVMAGSRGDDAKLIKASSQASAIRFATRACTAEVADQDTLVRLVQGGAKIEEGN